jgi:hypothetical protein
MVKVGRWFFLFNVDGPFQFLTDVYVTMSSPSASNHPRTIYTSPIRMPLQSKGGRSAGAKRRLKKREDRRREKYRSRADRRTHLIKPPRSLAFTSLVLPRWERTAWPPVPSARTQSSSRGGSVEIVQRRGRAPAAERSSSAGGAGDRRGRVPTAFCALSRCVPVPRFGTTFPGTRIVSYLFSEEKPSASHMCVRISLHTYARQNE